MSTIDIRSPGGVDASTTKKGQIKLAGDLGGTAASPTVVGVQANVITPAMMEHGTRGDILTYNGSGGPPTRLAAGADNLVLTASGATADVGWEVIPVPTTLGAIEIVDGSATVDLSAANCKQTMVTNYGQGSGIVTLTLPAAVAGLAFTAIVETAPGAFAWWIKPYASGYIYLDGLLLTIDYKVGISTPLVGNVAQFFTFRFGASEWRWYCSTISGLWASANAV